jgi:hypothetical protein
MNYGINPLFTQINSAWHHHEDIRRLYYIWDNSLVSDFFDCLFNRWGRIDLPLPSVTVHSFLQNTVDTEGTFESRRHFEDFRMLEEALVALDRDVRHHRRQFTFPHSYVAYGFIKLIRYLRQSVKINPSDDSEWLAPSFVDFLYEKLTEDWIEMFGSTPPGYH